MLKQAKSLALFGNGELGIGNGEDSLFKKLRCSHHTLPILIATVHKNHEQTGEMMGLAWEFKQLQNSSNNAKNSPLFLLAHKNGNSEVATATLHETISKLPRPFDLWAVNFAASVEAEKVNCLVDNNSRKKVPGYSYKLYRCL